MLCSPKTSPLLVGCFGLVLAGLLPLHTAQAVAFRQGKATDDSVCDLSPWTSVTIGRKVVIPSSAPTNEQVEAFARMATRFIVDSCSSGQTLILDSGDGDPIDQTYLPDLAGSLCVVGNIVRRDVASSSTAGERQRKGFELRCQITKLKEFKAQSEVREKAESTEAFIVRLQQSAAARSQGIARADEQQPSKKDCRKMSISSMLTGGACR